MQPTTKECTAQSAPDGSGAHSKTWRTSLRSVMRDSVLECASPLALSFVFKARFARSSCFRFLTRTAPTGIRKISLGLVLAGLICWRAPSALAAADDVQKFLLTQAARSYTNVPHEVLAFYYPWYGTPQRHGHWEHWENVDPEHHDIGSARHYPAKGAYDSWDPNIIDWQIDLAKSNGITGFISSWWGKGNTTVDGALPIIIDRAAKKNFKVSVYWEVAPGNGRDQIDQAIHDLTYLVTNFGTNSAFLKVNGKPVIFVYGRVMGQVPTNSWPEIISQARAQAGDFVLIADGYKSNYTRLFDGLHTYNICGQVARHSNALREYAAGAFAGAVKLARSSNRISCVTVIPGYDDTKIRHPGLKADRADGETYRILWEEAIKANPDWILITSWNEWHEGSEIEPSFEEGDKYIKITGLFAPGFRDSAPVKAHALTEVQPVSR